jgi:hypothetical protein
MAEVSPLRRRMIEDRADRPRPLDVMPSASRTPRNTSVHRDFRISSRL